MPAHSFSDPNNGWLSLAARIKFPRPPASVLFVNDLKTLEVVSQIGKHFALL